MDTASRMFCLSCCVTNSAFKGCISLPYSRYLRILSKFIFRIIWIFDVLIWIAKHALRADESAMGTVHRPLRMKSHQAARELRSNPRERTKHLDRHEFDTTRDSTDDRAETGHSGDSATCCHCWWWIWRSDSSEKAGQAACPGNVNRPQQLPSLPTDDLPGRHLGSRSC